MTTVAHLLERLAESGRGRIFLVNLKDTLDHGFDAAPLRDVCRDLATIMATVPDEQATADELAQELGRRCETREFWRHSSEPSLRRGDGTAWTRLSRVITYGTFYTSVLNRSLTGPPLEVGNPPGTNPPGPVRWVPKPRALVGHGATEIAPEHVADVRAYVNSGAWKASVDSRTVRFGNHCVWAAPQAELARRLRRAKKALPDFHRDMIGLSHMVPGHHLIRLDFDLAAWPDGTGLLRRRPHGACNGGPRFRMRYDGPPCSANWGRTVNLGVLAARRRAWLDGVPEMVMEPFIAPVDAVTAHYVGEVRSVPDKDDDYFLKRMTRVPIGRIVHALAEVLS